MSTRELIALGTASQVPTRRRNHNGYFLRWDDEGFLFDPGEGTQRQMAHADLAASQLHRVCITHFHGDHCLGLAGVLQHLSLDRVAHPVTVHYPRYGQAFFERLRYASIYHEAAEVVPAPFGAEPEGRDAGLFVLAETEAYTLYAHALAHSVPAYGYRLEEKPGIRFLPEKLAEMGVRGPAVSQLAREGSLRVGERTVTLDEVSTKREGSVFAMVMDTGVCEGAVVLARDADVLLIEATYAGEEAGLAAENQHLCAADAGRIAREAGARSVALTHFSRRYTDTSLHVEEARRAFGGPVLALDDLARIEVPRRR